MYPLTQSFQRKRFESLVDQVGASIVLSCAANADRLTSLAHQVIDVSKQTWADNALTVKRKPRIVGVCSAHFWARPGRRKASR